MRYRELCESLVITPEQAVEILSFRGVHRGVKISPNLKLWRGTNTTTGNNAASFGSGLYFTADKSVAKDFAGDYGKIHEIPHTLLPRNPLRFNTRQDFEIWEQNAIFKVLGYKRKNEFWEDVHDFKEFIHRLDPTIDGIQMYVGKDAEFVNYNASRITEEFAGAFVPFYSKDKTPCEVFKNPSKQEYRNVAGRNDEVRAFIVGTDLYIWNINQSLHQTVREELKLPDDSLSIVIEGRVGGYGYVTVTDNIRHSHWFHNPEVANVINNNPWINRLFNEIEIGYFDDAIYGDWAHLDSEEDEDEDVSENIINELFDTETNGPIKRYGDSILTNFNVNNEDYVVEFTDRGKNKYWIVFYKKKNKGKNPEKKYSNSNDMGSTSIKVMSAILDILSRFIEKYKPNELGFIADIESGKANLYKNILKYLKRKYNFALSVEKEDDDTEMFSMNFVLQEDVQNTNKAVFDEIARISEEYNVNLQCTVNSAVVHILSLTRKGAEKGTAALALEELLNLTDMLGLNVTLTASEGHPRLIRYYMAHGFQIANMRPQDQEKWLDRHALDWSEAVENGEDLSGVSMIHYAD